MYYDSYNKIYKEATFGSSLPQEVTSVGCMFDLAEFYTEYPYWRNPQRGFVIVLF